MQRAVLPLLLVAAAACVAPPLAAPPVPAEASAALTEARTALRDGDEAAFERARAALERAQRIAPDWVAPRRALDDLLRRDLVELEALAAYRATLEHSGEDAATLYLAGRLEGPAGSTHFARAARLDPTLAWAWHGLAVSGSREGGLAPRAAAERALALARDPVERTLFTASLARLDASAGRIEEAVALLDARAADPEVGPADRVELGVQAAVSELGAPSFHVVEDGIERALAILCTQATSDAETLELFAALQRALPGAEPARVALALAARPGALRDRLRAEILLDESPTPLALGLLERATQAGGGDLPRTSVLRAARFSAGDPKGAIERWLADLPSVVIGPDGLPRDPRLARVVHAARAHAGRDLGDAERAARTTELARALVDAGWFREARAVAARLAHDDLDAATAIDAAALSGRTFLTAVRRLLGEIDAGQRDPIRGSIHRKEVRRDPDTAPALRGRKVPPRTLDGLLLALAPRLAEARTFRGEPVVPEVLREQLVASPRRSYAGFAVVLHPGPVLSPEDEDEGLGPAGSPVEGFAAELARLGRFAIFGVLGGDAPDGTILPVLHVEERSGTHLGAHWHGTIAWCESADVPSRAGRGGARIAGAALHEGYWVDVDAVRAEVRNWDALARRFERAPERVERALRVRGLDAARGDEGRAARTSLDAPLGATQRVRLAVLRDRAAPGAALGRVGLDELVEITAQHEEGHLCDRARFLPLRANWPRALALLLDAGFSARAVQEELELRAQLTVLCVADDPRIPLAQALEGAEGGSDATPHAQGYERLIEGFLGALDRRVQAGEFAAVAPDRTLVHQLHLLGPEDVRAIGLELAHGKGLVER